MRPGVRIGVDPGTVRVGFARSDDSGLLAFPAAVAKRGVDDQHTLESLIRDYSAIEVYVGLPVGLSGADTRATAAVREYARSLAEHIFPIPVRAVDERLTTVSASSALRATGKDARKQRESIDAAAAAILLQHVLDSEASSGQAPGEVIAPHHE